MNTTFRTAFPIFLVAVAVAAVALAATPVLAGGHTWRVKEFFSNADGTIQYVEVWEANGTPGEIGTANHNVTSNTNVFTIPANVASPTTFRSLLLATQAFADLNIVTPDYIIADSFLSVAADSISYTPFHTVTFGAGQLPTDGIHALTADLSVVVNSPANYAGETGTLDLSPSPPGVSATGPTPLTVVKPTPDGSQLQLSFDTASCTGNTGHQVLYGFGSTIPSMPGGSFGVGGAGCDVAASPFDWLGVPDPSADGTRLLWFLVQSTDGASTEGSWGKDSGDSERSGPGTAGSSGQCGMADKDLSNTCGQ